MTFRFSCKDVFTVEFIQLLLLSDLTTVFPQYLYMRGQACSLSMRVLAKISMLKMLQWHKILFKIRQDNCERNWQTQSILQFRHKLNKKFVPGRNCLQALVKGRRYSLRKMQNLSLSGWNRIHLDEVGLSGRRRVATDPLLVLGLSAFLQVVL